MQEDEQLELLNKLRFGDSPFDRSQALKDLKVMEMEGRIDEDSLLRLLADKDFVYKSYAIGAIGRLRVKEAINALCALFRDSSDPMLLMALIDTFIAFESDEFVGPVLERLETLVARAEKDSSGNQAFLLEQVAAPSLKYLQIAGNNSVEPTVKRFLTVDDPTIRWHALITFDKLNLFISEEELERLAREDAYALVREQAAVMLEKRDRQS